MSTPISSTSNPLYFSTAGGSTNGTSSAYTPSTATGSAAAASSSASSSSSSSGKSAYLQLTPADFVKMMITQLQNQDPQSPTSSADILSQISQIGQLQASDTMQTSMQSLVLQDQLASSSSFIGRSVQGLDSSNNTISGIVDSIHVDSGTVNLQLDSGQSLAIGRVTDIDPAATSTAGATTGSGSSGTSSNTAG